MPETMQVDKAAPPRSPRKPLEERALAAIVEALTGAARAQDERGDHELSVFLYDRACEYNERLKQVERILAEHERTLFSLLPVALEAVR